MASESRTSKETNSSVCRVCLYYDYNTELGKGLSLFERDNDILIAEQINELTNISIKENDGFPDRICPPCHLQLQSAYKFKKTCENTNKLLLLAANDIKEICKSPVENLPIKYECPDDDENCVDESNDLKEDSIDEKHNVESGNNTDENQDVECSDDNIDVKHDVKCSDDSIDEKHNIESFKDSADNVGPSTKPSRAIDLKLECHDCGGYFPSKFKLSVHWKRVHLPQLEIKCSRCLLKFKTFAALKNHNKKNLKSCVTAGKFRIEGEGKNLVYHCRECNFKTKHKFNLSVHQGLHTENKRFQCHACPSSYTTKSGLDRHLECVHKLYSSEATCKLCGKTIKGKERMKTHMRSHKTKGSFECKICKAKLLCEQSLRQHIVRHSNIKSFMCDICSKSFYTSGELSGHRNSAHLKSKMYECGKCSFKSPWPASMKRHRGLHTDTNVYCNICAVFLDNDLQMTIHKEKHTDSHHKCPHCDKTFCARRLLSRHVLKTHKRSILDSLFIL